MKRVLCVVLLVAAAGRAPAADRPKLILQITIDQLRGDLPLRYEDRFEDGGFRYFLQHGIWYSDAHHPGAYMETVVGHTTLATGAFQSRHGMIANYWYDRVTGETVNNVEDAHYAILPMDRKLPGPGASPRTILTTTFSDELSLATAGNAKVFAVSGKDRGAIPMAGHSGKAFWYSNDNGCFVTSTFYYASYPDWVVTWCNRGLAKNLLGKEWTLLHPLPTYLYRDQPNRYPEGTPAEKNMVALDRGGFGRNFPHKARQFYELTTTPAGDELTVNFAKELIDREHLGEDDVPDYLSVSLSATDYVGHLFSPASLESEDNILRLDGTLKDLLSFVDEKIGLEHTLVILSGDHGGTEYPEYLERYGINTGRVQARAIRDAAVAALHKKLGVGPEVIATLSMPYFYLDHAVMEREKLDPLVVERVIAAAAMSVDGVALAVSTIELRRGGEESDDAIVERLRRNDEPRRSGDVFVVQLPQWQADENASGPFLLLQHASLWDYDSYVPVAFAGGHLPALRIARPIFTTDVAATLAVYARTKFPSGESGAPLTEVIATQDRGNP